MGNWMGNFPAILARHMPVLVASQTTEIISDSDRWAGCQPAFLAKCPTYGTDTDEGTQSASIRDASS